MARYALGEAHAEMVINQGAPIAELCGVPGHAARGGRERGRDGGVGGHCPTPAHPALSTNACSVPAPRGTLGIPAPADTVGSGALCSRSVSRNTKGRNTVLYCRVYKAYHSSTQHIFKSQEVANPILS